MFAFLTVAALIAGAFAVPTVKPTPDVSPVTTLCTSTAMSGTCLSVPISPDACTSLTGGLTVLNDGVGSAQIPGGFVCTFFQNAGCLSALSADAFTVEALGTEAFDFSSVPGEFGTTSFLDDVSSFSCSII
ncbi:hypothetical protein BDQ17DRAFT_1430057 [Cyathus striatus]|nr:hypothetical protein BDQ17DRAFT_1430057 [Cyathus striatus]